MRMPVRYAAPAFAPSPMLAQLERTLPHGDVWRYEPKLDGFRGLSLAQGRHGEPTPQP
jgi:ATP-dependent DNA ligase